MVIYMLKIYKCFVRLDVIFLLSYEKKMIKIYVIVGKWGIVMIDK